MFQGQNYYNLYITNQPPLPPLHLFGCDIVMQLSFCHLSFVAFILLVTAGYLN